MTQENHNSFKKGDWVAWKWANGIAEGQISEVHYRRTEVISKGKRIVRNGTNANPALIISHKSGNEVLKLACEVKKPIMAKRSNILL